MAPKLSPFTQKIAEQLCKVDLEGLRIELERRETDRAARRAAARATETDVASKNSWYNKSYAIFTALGPPNSLSDFVQRIAFAYSWLVTIPTAEPGERHFRAAKDAVRKVLTEDNLPSGLSDLGAMERRWCVRHRLIEIVQEAIAMKTDHSVVAVSKVLHFWEPRLAPMIDDNVSEGLRELPTDLRAGFIDNLIGDVRMGRYLWYWELAFRMRAPVAQGGQSVDYRRLDQLLFLLGKHARTRRR